MGPCTCAFFYPRSKRPWMVYILLLSFPLRIFLRLVGKAASPPIVFTPALWGGFHLTIEFVYFYKVSFQHLGILEKLEDSAPLSRVIIFGLLCPTFFRRRLRSFQQNISPANLCARCWGFPFRSIFFSVSSLVVGFQPCLKCTVSWGIRSIIEVPFDGSMSPLFFA